MGIKSQKSAGKDSQLWEVRVQHHVCCGVLLAQWLERAEIGQNMIYIGCKMGLLVH